MTLHPSLTQTSDLLIRYQQIRKQSELICQPLKTEDYVVQPALDASPPKWHLGHTTWFFENFILAHHLKDYQLFNPKLNYLFNSYYESQGPRILRSNRGNMSRPTLKEIMDYRKYVDKGIKQLFSQFSESTLPKEVRNFLGIGMQHEQQHQELLVTDIKYILGHNPLFPALREEEEPSIKESTPVPAASFFTIPAGIYSIGHDADSFCWDNELSSHSIYLQEYQIQNRLVTNGEYLEFMQAGGYEQFEHWLSEGWEWVKQLEVKAPEYWFEQDGEWYQYTLHGLKKLDLNLPVTHVNYFEADAYAQWKEMRLPTEFEWETACRQISPNIPESGNFLETNQLHPVVVQNKNDFQFLGNAWEWTASAYLPYPNYPRLKGALGEYNGKFMVNQMVLRGGSCATPISHIRLTYRNFFHADKRWQFTGIRLAR